MNALIENNISPITKTSTVKKLKIQKTKTNKPVTDIKKLAAMPMEKYIEARRGE
jgi:hypothetical protein